jgi:hypothetical protein
MMKANSWQLLREERNGLPKKHPPPTLSEQPKPPLASTTRLERPTANLLFLSTGDA